MRVACKSSKRANTGDSLYNLNALNDQFIPTCVDNWESKTTKDWKEMNWKNWMMMLAKACKLLFLRVHASPEFRAGLCQINVFCDSVFRLRANKVWGEPENPHS